MDKINFEFDKQDESIEQIMEKLNSIDIIELERQTNPLFSDLKDIEINILEFIINELYAKDDFYGGINGYNIVENFSEIEESTIKDSLDILESNNILNTIGGHFYKLSPSGFFNYAPIFLDINTQKDIDDVLKFIMSNNSSGEYCSGKKIQEVTNIPPIRIDYAIKILELSGYINVHKGMGNAPYEFYNVSTTPKGRRQFRNE